MNTINDCVIIDIPKIIDQRGNLAVIEGATIPFDFKRVYYLFDIPAGSTRGGHAHKEQYELLLPLSGSFDVIINDGNIKTPIKDYSLPPKSGENLKTFLREVFVWFWLLIYLTKKIT